MSEKDVKEDYVSSKLLELKKHFEDMPYEELEQKYLEAKAANESLPPERRGRLVLDMDAVADFYKRQEKKKNKDKI